MRFVLVIFYFFLVRPFNGKLMPKYDGSPNGNHEKDAQNIREK